MAGRVHSEGEVEEEVKRLSRPDFIHAGARRAPFLELRPREFELLVHALLAIKLPIMSTPEQRDVLLSLDPRVEVREHSISIKLGGDVALGAATQLVRKGTELRLSLPPAGAPASKEPDPALFRLVAHARAAQKLLVTGDQTSAVTHYGKRHLWQLLRINWLAPDIISAIVDGTQPVDLTGRRLLRATDIPLDWGAQRRLFGFS